MRTSNMSIRSAMTQFQFEINKNPYICIYLYTCNNIRHSSNARCRVFIRNYKELKEEKEEKKRKVDRKWNYCC